MSQERERLMKCVQEIDNLKSEVRLLREGIYRALVAENSQEAEDILTELIGWEK